MSVRARVVSLFSVLAAVLFAFLMRDGGAGHIELARVISGTIEDMGRASGLGASTCGF